MIVDTPPDFRSQCLANKVSRVDAVFYTHFHADHVMGADDLRRYNRLQGGKLPVYLNESTKQRFEQTFDYAIDKDHPPHLIRPRFSLTTLTDSPVRIGNLVIQPVTVMHGSLPISGFVFSHSERKKRIAYLTDCKTLPPETVAHVLNAEAVILSALWQEWEHKSHLNLPEALKLGKNLKAGTLYLTHVTHHMGKHAQVSQTLPPNVHLAYDGLTITV